MQEEWWKKLSSESMEERLPVVFKMVKIGFITYLVILAMLLLFLPWKKETTTPIQSPQDKLYELL